MVNGSRWRPAYAAPDHCSILPFTEKETEPSAPMTDMARQDQANDQFSLTSFLYGGNADYIEAAARRL